MNNFETVEFSDDSKLLSRIIKQKYYELQAEILRLLPDGRSRSMVLMHLEESQMWVGKSIRDKQLMSESYGNGKP